MKNLFIITCFLLVSIPCLSLEELGEGIFLEKNSQNIPGKLKIAVATVIINEEVAKQKKKEVNYKEIVSFGTRSKEIYCKTHGYDFIIAEKKLSTCYGITEKRSLEPAWTKLALVSRILDDYDWVFWTDADSIILNFDIKLEDFIDTEYDLIACTESENQAYPDLYTGGNFINTGQVFYKNSEIAKYIILEAWNLHEEYTKNSYEQARINHVIQSQGLHQNVCVHPPKHFNLKPEAFSLGDFLVHMYAYHGRALHRIMKKFEMKYSYILEDAEKNLTLKSESY